MRWTRLPLAAALISTGCGAPQDVFANILTVSNCNDAGAGSLRSALGAATNDDVVDMTQLMCSTITLATSSGALQTSASAANLTVNGPTGHVLTIDGASHDRVIRHRGSGTLALNDVTIVNGKYNPAGGVNAQGGCIEATTGSVALTRSHVSSCITQRGGHGGCINAFNHLTLINSTLTLCEGGNEAAKSDSVTLQDSSITNSAGGVGSYNAYLRNSVVTGNANEGVNVVNYLDVEDSTISGNGAAGIHTTGDTYCDEYGYCGGTVGSAMIRSSIISGNAKGGVVSSDGEVAVYGSVIERNQGRGGIYDAFSLKLTDTLVCNNAAQVAPLQNRSAGGIFANTLNATRSTISGNSGVDAGGVLATSATLLNTTISNNRAASGSKPVGGIKTTTGAVTAYNSTIAFNSGDAVGGIYAPSAKIVSSIIGGNNNVSPAYNRNLFLLGNSTFANNVIASSNLPTGAISADPKLTPLANHGGLMPTHALLGASSALGAGSNAMNVATDIRGSGFARVVGANTDSGAYERQDDEDEIFGNGMDGW